MLAGLRRVAGAVRRVRRTLFEAAGVAVIAGGAWWRVDPFWALLLIGLYLVLVANVEVNRRTP